MHFKDDCQCGSLWKPILYTKVVGELRHIVLEWQVSLPTCWGVLIQWGGAYLGLTIGIMSHCPVPSVS